MSIEIVSCPPDRWAEYVGVLEHVFAAHHSPRGVETFRRACDLNRMFAALEDDRIVGTAGVLTFRMNVPGGEVPAGGVTVVTVLPSHRRRGLMSAMMRRMIDDCRARGEAVAILWASEGAIYQRFGYGLATKAMRIEADARYRAFAREWPREGSVRLIAQDAAREIVGPVYEAARTGSASLAARAGFLERSPDWWYRVLHDEDPDTKIADAKRIAVFAADAGPEAYAIYEVKSEWDERGPRFELSVDEAIGSTPRGTREIWRYLLEIDLVGTLKAVHLPPDHALFALMAEPRRLGAKIGDAIWLRVVDVAAALASRTYGPDGRASGRLVLDLSDDYCPWNAGRWSLEVDGGRAAVTPTTAEADLALDANDLAATYLGGTSASALAQVGRLTELRSGGLGTADLLFSTALSPWCPDAF